jgi:hypothetical protein
MVLVGGMHAARGVERRRSARPQRSVVRGVRAAQAAAREAHHQRDAPRGRSSPRYLNIEPLYAEPFIAVLPATSPLAEREEILLAELAREPFVGLSRWVDVRASSTGRSKLRADHQVGMIWPGAIRRGRARRGRRARVRTAGGSATFAARDAARSSRGALTVPRAEAENVPGPRRVLVGRERPTSTATPWRSASRLAACRDHGVRSVGMQSSRRCPRRCTCCPNWLSRKAVGAGFRPLPLFAL